MLNQEKVQAVSRMQTFIQNHIKDPISLNDLAKAAGYSPWHASRLFKDLVGESAFDYIRKLRLTKAALALRDTDSKVIDVAFDFVFNSHEGFTRAFSKFFGLSPKKYALTTPPIGLFLPYQVTDLYTKKGAPTMSNPTTVFVQVVEKSARKLLLKRGTKATHYFEYCDEVGCDVWGILTSVKEAIQEPMGLWLPTNMRPAGTSEYVQGVEVPLDYQGVVPQGFDLVDLPPCKIMVFQGPAFNDEDFGEAIQNLWAAIDTYDPTLYGFEWAPHDAPRFQLEPQGYRGYIEGRPVKAL